MINKSFIKSVHPICIGLLTPYGGTNLGDGAIQTAAIQGIQRQLPEAELWGITLNPLETTKRHNIPALPITGLRIPFYSESLFKPIDGLFTEFLTETTIEKNKFELHLTKQSDYKQVWQNLKKLPVLGFILKFMVSVLRNIFMIIHEIGYLKRSFGFTKTLDIIIVSGGGQLDEAWGGPWGHPYALFRWAVLAKLARKKFIVVSVGVGELKTFFSKFLIKRALNLACYRSYRDLVSKRLLDKWLFTRKDVCVPDLALGLHLVPEKMTRRSGSVNKMAQLPTVGISPIAFGLNTVSPYSEPEIYSRYLSILVDFMAFLIERGYLVVLFKSTSIDRRSIRDLKTLIMKNWTEEAQKNVSVPIVETVEDLFANVEKLDFIVASRLHSVIVSHVVGKPVLAICLDRKVDTHMRDMDQAEYILDMRNFNLSDLINRFEDLVSNEEFIHAGISDKILSAKKSLEEQYKCLSSLLNTTTKLNIN